MAGEMVVIDGVRYRAPADPRLGLGKVEELVITTAQVAPAPVETTQTTFTPELAKGGIVSAPEGAPLIGDLQHNEALVPLTPPVEPAPAFEPPTPLAPPADPVAPASTPVKESSDGEPRTSKRPRNAARSSTD
jgi:hypothetical protein